MSNFKKPLIKVAFVCVLLFSFSSNGKIKMLYSSIEKESLAKQFAFLSLFPNSEEAGKIKEHLNELIKMQLPNFLFDPTIAFQFSTLFNANVEADSSFIDSVVVEKLKVLTDQFPNKQLKGNTVYSFEALKGLAVSEVDLSRGLLLIDSSQPQSTYETLIDLMTLQIQAYLPKNPTPMDKIKAINQFLFYDLGIRFPPESLFAKNVDTYTFLPAVLDSRLGVCLGVSALYLCLAQHLDLPLEIITPPGHIYLRYRDDQTLLNIETTARGIHIPNEHYLGVNTCALQERNIKEVLGMVLINEASIFWHKKDYETTIDRYEKALVFLPSDGQLHEFLGIQYFLTKQFTKAKMHLEFAKNHPLGHVIYQSTLIDDVLNRTCTKEAIEAIFEPIDSTFESVLKKQKELKKIVKKNPRFATGYFHLAVATLQLGQELKAVPHLEKYLTFHPKDPVVHYYLGVVFFETHAFEKAWKHLLLSESHFKNKKPKALNELRLQLQRIYPRS